MEIKLSFRLFTGAYHKIVKTVNFNTYYTRRFVSEALKRILSVSVINEHPRPTGRGQETQIRGNKRQLGPDDYKADEEDVTVLSTYETPVMKINRIFEPSTTMEQEIATPNHFKDEHLLNEYNEEYLDGKHKNYSNNGIDTQYHFWDKNAKSNINVLENRKDKPFLGENVLQHLANDDNEKQIELFEEKNLKVDKAVTAKVIKETMIESLRDKLKNIEESTIENIGIVTKTLHEKTFIPNVFDEYEEIEYWNKLFVTPRPSVSTKTTDTIEDLSDNQHTLLPQFILRIGQTKTESKTNSNTPSRTKRKRTYIADVPSTPLDIFSTKILSRIFTSSTQPKTITPLITPFEIIYKTRETIAQRLPQYQPVSSAATSADNEMYPTRTEGATKANYIKTTKQHVPKTVHFGIIEAPTQFSNVLTTKMDSNQCAVTNEGPQLEYLNAVTVTESKLPFLERLRSETNSEFHDETTQLDPIPNLDHLCKICFIPTKTPFTFQL